ncbi:hypothetical protein HDU97_004464 [Phlyctochytrium planicorne]|nr:hypothetical protein HDU97_004464 [Phlyctochytrium planicorne]
MKRKAKEESTNPPSDNEEEEKEAEDEAGEDSEDIIDVDFDFFDPREIDFHGLKSLLRQTFLQDAERFNLSDMADAIIAQPHIGSIVKVDDSTDPYAVVTALSFTHTSLKPLADYLIEKCKKDAAVQKKLTSVFKDSHVGFLINERLVNMPAEIIAPMFKMLIEELEWSVEERKEKPYDYFVLVAKTFSEAEPEDEESKEPERKKGKKEKRKGAPQFFNIHAEDEVFQEFAEAVFDFSIRKSSEEEDSAMGLSHARRA